MTDYYKAGDFTNGKMNEIFKTAVRSTATIKHRQFGFFTLMDSELESDLTELRKMLSKSYHTRNELFFLACMPYEDEEIATLITAPGYINECMSGRYMPLSVLDSLYLIVEDENVLSKEVNFKGFLNEIYHIGLQFIIDFIAQESGGDVTISIHDVCLGMQSNERYLDLVYYHVDKQQLYDCISIMINQFSFMTNFDLITIDDDNPDLFTVKNIFHLEQNKY